MTKELEKKIKNIISQAIDYTLCECMLGEAGHHELDLGKQPKLIRETTRKILSLIK